MRHAGLGQDQIIDDMGKPGEIAGRDLQEIIGIAGERIGLLDLPGLLDEILKPRGVFLGVGRKAHLNEGAQPNAEARAVKPRVIALDHARLLEPNAPSRALGG